MHLGSISISICTKLMESNTSCNQWNGLSSLKFFSILINTLLMFLAGTTYVPSIILE